MNSFEYQAPTKILFGKDRIRTLPDELLEHGSRVLLVYGKGSVLKNGIHASITGLLRDRGIHFKELPGVDPNPRVDTARNGIRLCREHNLDFVLALGGGSVIDCSKLIALGFHYEGDPWDLSTREGTVDQALPLGCVLTLSATGSEMNSTFVISNRENHEKRGCRHPLAHPRFSILDPTLTFSVPVYHTAAGVADIMAHVFEFYFSDTEEAFISRRICEAVLTTCIHYGEKVLSEPDNYEARANLMWASSLALNGVTKGGNRFDGFNHELEHVISGLYDISHGVGLAIIIPPWMDFILEETTIAPFLSYAENVWGIIGEDPMDTARKGIAKTREFFGNLGLPNSFLQEGIGPEHHKDILDRCFETKETMGSFRKIDRDGVAAILQNASQPA